MEQIILIFTVIMIAFKNKSWIVHTIHTADYYY